MPKEYFNLLLQNKEQKSGGRSWRAWKKQAKQQHVPYTTVWKVRTLWPYIRHAWRSNLHSHLQLATESSDLKSSSKHAHVQIKFSDTRRLQIRRGSRFIVSTSDTLIVSSPETENRDGFSSEPIILRSNNVCKYISRLLKAVRSPPPPPTVSHSICFSIMSPLSDTVKRFCRWLIHDSFERSL